MNKSLIVLGIILVAIGISVFSVSYYTTLIQNRTHRGVIPFGGVGIAVLGALIVVASVMMKPMGGKVCRSVQVRKVRNDVRLSGRARSAFERQAWNVSRSETSELQ